MTTTRDELQDKSKSELYELAQDRDIDGRSEMSKDDLIDALAEDGEDDGGTDEDGSDDTSSGSGSGSSSSGKVSAGDAIAAARRHLDDMVGRPVEGLIGVHRDGDGWTIELETLELSRTPASSDVLGVYAVGIDDDGDLTSLQRVGRHLRSEVGS